MAFWQQHQHLLLTHIPSYVHLKFINLASHYCIIVCLCVVKYVSNCVYMCVQPSKFFGVCAMFIYATLCFMVIKIIKRRRFKSVGKNWAPIEFRFNTKTCVSRYSFEWASFNYKVIKCYPLRLKPNNFVASRIVWIVAKFYLSWLL